jgi:undecaprenyl-diphosphatase
MTWIEAIVLGVLQGITEFLPVSSSGHLEIGSVLLGIETSDNLLFAMVVHAATALSTIVVFRKDIVAIIKDLFKFEWNESWDFTVKILISLLPVMVIGLLYKDEVEALFTGNLKLVGSMLIVTAVLLLITQFKKSNTGPVSKLGALIMGLAQAVAIIPGISRSGATIATGLMLGFDKALVTRFSFLMVLIPILGANFLELLSYLKEPNVVVEVSSSALAIGFFAAFIAGYLACTWMVNIVKKGKLVYFAIYCAVIGSLAIIFS